MSYEEQELWMTSLLDRVSDLEKEVAALKAKDLTKFEPDWANYRVGFDCGFAEAQEQAAKVCEELRHPNWSEEDHAWIMGTEACAGAIRAMKVEK